MADTKMKTYEYSSASIIQKKNSTNQLKTYIIGYKIIHKTCHNQMQNF